MNSDNTKVEDGATSQPVCQVSKTTKPNNLPIRNAHLLVNGTREIWPLSYYMKPLLLDSNVVAENSTSHAVCAVMYHQNLPHFPHASQQLFRCWSYWRQLSNWPPILYWKADKELRNASEYVVSLLDAYEHELGMTVIDGNVTETTQWDIGAMGTNKSLDFGLRSTEDARAFRAMVAPNATDPRCSIPRIAILNRKGARELVNVDYISSTLGRAFGIFVPVVYFEDSSFQFQMNFMANTDILISPHGAQLTSIIAMPICGGLLEVYPQNYYPISFFGSLADASGILHQPLYMGNLSAANVDMYHMPATYTERGKARAVRLCPNVEEVVQLTKRLVDASTKCCWANPLLLKK